MLSSMRRKKRAKTTSKSPEVVVETRSPKEEDERRILRCLIDSGSAGCIILNEFTAGLKKQNCKSAKWTTKGGIFSTDSECTVPFYIADFSTQKLINWTCHVDASDRSVASNYDMIIGKDLLNELGIDIKFSSGTLKWEDTEVPMRDFGELRDKQVAHHSYCMHEDAESVQEMQSRTLKILDAKCEPIDIPKVLNEQEQLTESEIVKLGRLLKKYESLFDGTLGDWKGPPVSYES